MSPKQLEEEVEVRGPPASKAFDDQGNPTKVFLSLWSFPLLRHGWAIKLTIESILVAVLELKEKAYELFIHWPLDFVLRLFF